MKIGEGSSIEEIEKQELPDVMPFGKHKGKLLCELAASYIQFLLINCDWIDDTLKGKLQKEFDKKRDDMPCYGKMYNNQSRECCKCPYLEGCASECEDNSEFYTDSDADQEHYSASEGYETAMFGHNG